MESGRAHTDELIRAWAVAGADLPRTYGPILATSTKPVATPPRLLAVERNEGSPLGLCAVTLALRKAGFPVPTDPAAVEALLASIAGAACGVALQVARDVAGSGVIGSPVGAQCAAPSSSDDPLVWSTRRFVNLGAVANRLYGASCVAPQSDGEPPRPWIPALPATLVGPADEVEELLRHTGDTAFHGCSDAHRIPVFVDCVRSMPVRRLVVGPLLAALGESGAARPGSGTALDPLGLGNPTHGLSKRYRELVADTVRQIVADNRTGLQSLFAQCVGNERWLPRDEFLVVFVTDHDTSAQLRVLCPRATFLVQPGPVPDARNTGHGLGYRGCAGLTRALGLMVAMGARLRTAVHLDDSLADIRRGTASGGGLTFAGAVRLLDAAAQQHPLGYTAVRAGGTGGTARWDALVDLQDGVGVGVFGPVFPPKRSLSECHRSDHAANAQVWHVANLWKRRVCYSLAHEVGEDVAFTALVQRSSLAVGKLLERGGTKGAFAFARPSERPGVCGGAGGDEPQSQAERAFDRPGALPADGARWDARRLAHANIVYADGAVVSCSPAGFYGRHGIFGPGVAITAGEAAKIADAWRAAQAASTAHWMCSPAAFSVADGRVTVRPQGMGPRLFDALSSTSQPRRLDDVWPPSGKAQGSIDPRFGGFVQVGAGQRTARGPAKCQLVHALLSSERARVFCAMASNAPVPDAAALCNDCSMPALAATVFGGLAARASFEAVVDSPPADLVADTGLVYDLLFYGPGETVTGRMWLNAAVSVFIAACSVEGAVRAAVDTRASVVHAVLSLGALGRSDDADFCTFIERAAQELSVPFLDELGVCYARRHLIAAAVRAVAIAKTHSTLVAPALPNASAASRAIRSKCPIFSADNLPGFAAPHARLRQASEQTTQGWSKWHPPAKRPHKE